MKTKIFMKVAGWHTLLCVAGLSLLLSGCENPMSEQELSSPTMFTATIEHDEATKTLLGALSGGERKVMWKTGDELIVGGATYVAGTLSNEGRKATLTGTGAQKEGTVYKAYYPTRIYNSGTPTLRDTQTYVAPTTEDGNLVVASHLPMYAQSETTELNFKNLCAVLNFRLKGTDKVTKVVVTSATMKLNGPFDVVADGTAFKAQMKSGAATDAEKKVTLDCSGVPGGGVQLDAAAETEFCIAVPAADYAKDDLTVQVFGPGDTEIMPSFKNSVSISQLKRSEIYDIAKTADSYTYVFTVTDPTDMVYSGGTSTTGSVVSYKYTGSDVPANRSAVAWGVEGYYPTAADAAAGTNKLSSISATYLKAFTPASQTGGYAGESVTINYAAASAGYTSVDMTGEITAKLKSNAGAYVRRGSAASYWNLANPTSGATTSIAESANTYIVNAPGYYCFPLVMGNGIRNNAKNTFAYRQTNFVNYQGTDLNTATSSPLLNDQGGTPASAYIVWAGADMVDGANSGNDWTLPSGCITSSTLSIDGESKTVYWLNFQITEAAIQQGCVVLAVTDGSGTVMWSWTIWVTDYVPQDGRSGYSSSSDLADVECTYDAAGNKVTFMPRNLGWVETGLSVTKYDEASTYVRLQQTGTDNFAVMTVIRPEENVLTGGHRGHHPSYQFGRKDAMVPASDITEQTISPLYGRFAPSGIYTSRTAPTYMKDAIQHPEFFCVGIRSSNDWNRILDFGWWCAGNTEMNVDKATVKTIYDPCPARYTVPRYNAYFGFRIGTSSNVANAKDAWSYGCLYWNCYRASESDPTSGMETIFFPTCGHRDMSGFFSTTNSVYWQAVVAGGTRMYGGVSMNRLTIEIVTLLNRADGLSIRPALEEIILNGTTSPYGPGSSSGF